MGTPDEGKKSSGVPSWQTKPSSTSETNMAQGELELEGTSSHASVVEKARKFLQDDEVKHSSTDKKIAFLESKGLESNVIQELLGVSRNVEASNAQQPLATAGTDVPSPSSSQLPTSSTTSQVSRDAPPIITYPEFLTTPAQQAPLITASRLLTTLYLFGGLSALLYGTSTYLIKPMVASLTSSRHTLAEFAQSNLNKLISQLEATVSEKPSAPIPLIEKYQDQVDDEDSDGDPTELFHRDIGVQTSIPTSPTSSRPTSPTPVLTALDDQTSRLSSLTDHIKGLNEASGSESQDASDLITTVNVLREYLESLAYIAPQYGFGGIYGNNAERRAGEQDDEIAKLKAQIRSVKGALLTAKSFPGTDRAR